MEKPINEMVAATNQLFNQGKGRAERSVVRAGWPGGSTGGERRRASISTHATGRSKHVVKIEHLCIMSYPYDYIT